MSTRAGCFIEDVFDNRGFDFRNFPYLAFFNGNALVRFGERDAAVLAGLWFVMNGLRDFVWQGHDTGFALMPFLAAWLSAGRAARGCVSSFPGIVRGWRFMRGGGVSFIRGKPFSQVLDFPEQEDDNDTENPEYGRETLQRSFRGMSLRRCHAEPP